VARLARHVTLELRPASMFRSARAPLRPALPELLPTVGAPSAAGLSFPLRPAPSRLAAGHAAFRKT